MFRVHSPALFTLVMATSICANITLEKLFLKGLLLCFLQYFRGSIIESLPYQIMLRATWCMQSIIQLSDLFQEKIKGNIQPYPVMLFAVHTV